MKLITSRVYCHQYIYIYNFVNGEKLTRYVCFFAYLQFMVHRNYPKAKFIFYSGRYLLAEQSYKCSTSLNIHVGVQVMVMDSSCTSILGCCKTDNIEIWLLCQTIQIVEQNLTSYLEKHIFTRKINIFAEAFKYNTTYKIIKSMHLIILTSLMSC